MSGSPASRGRRCSARRRKREAKQSTKYGVPSTERGGAAAVRLFRWKTILPAVGFRQRRRDLHRRERLRREAVAQSFHRHPVEPLRRLERRQAALTKIIAGMIDQIVHRADDGAVQRFENRTTLAAGAISRRKMNSRPSATRNSRIPPRAASRNWPSSVMPRPWITTE